MTTAGVDKLHAPAAPVAGFLSKLSSRQLGSDDDDDEAVTQTLRSEASSSTMMIPPYNRQQIGTISSMRHNVDCD